MNDEAALRKANDAIRPLIAWGIANDLPIASVAQGILSELQVLGWRPVPDGYLPMPAKASERMIASMNVITEVVLETVNKIDVSLIYETAVATEKGRVALLAAGMDEDGQPLAQGDVLPVRETPA